MVRQKSLVGFLEADGVYCRLRRFTIFPFAETILPLNLRAVLVAVFVGWHRPLIVFQSLGSPC